MTWTIHIANASGRLDGLVSAIRSAIARAQTQAEAVTEPVDIDLVVQAWPGRVIEHLGHAGYAPTDDMIQLTLDPTNANCAENLGEPLERTIVHELHHVLRWRGPGYGRTLGEALVTEGLAGHFAQQLYGGPPEKWESSLDAEGLAEAARDAEAAWDDDAYDHAAWFFGNDPAWRGYALGYALVGRFLLSHPKETPATLIHAEAARFRDDCDMAFG
ncbi:hypothetical protein ROJ8625_00258 [Roseivivax jejudonensis]|uniref:DUF2268 domain-containing protein n=1 Tax=Roseivivax jejudonensis TaxID=1529041 RepID=A0A1X6Y5S8_9RHOB|nr:DUF2268 domain-containing putative Zn-dependent protease [Roseivivax jejudonensis]SLN11399.1 hypothetical protein ROJ8625_00258 [Roseivivax jejudonensis]